MEADFARYYPGEDYRDRYRPGGGVRRLTVRRLLVLVSGLPPESSFKSAIEDRPPVSEVSAAVMDLWSAWHNNTEHPRWSALKRAREKAEFNELLEQERAEARAHNTIYLQAQKAQQAN